MLRAFVCLGLFASFQASAVRGLSFYPPSETARKCREILQAADVSDRDPIVFERANVQNAAIQLLGFRRDLEEGDKIVVKIGSGSPWLLAKKFTARESEHPRSYYFFRSRVGHPEITGWMVLELDDNPERPTVRAVGTNMRTRELSNLSRHSGWRSVQSRRSVMARLHHRPLLDVFSDSTIYSVEMPRRLQQ